MSNLGFSSASLRQAATAICLSDASAPGDGLGHLTSISARGEVLYVISAANGPFPSGQVIDRRGVRRGTIFAKAEFAARVAAHPLHAAIDEMLTEFLRIAQSTA